jgi:hypothetical protein
MHATHVLHSYLGKMCQAIHKTRLQATIIGVRALMYGKTLSVTGIGILPYIKIVSTFIAP